jgi:hypothetical protein
MKRVGNERRVRKRMGRKGKERIDKKRNRKKKTKAA